MAAEPRTSTAQSTSPPSPSSPHTSVSVTPSASATSFSTEATRDSKILANQQPIVSPDMLEGTTPLNKAFSMPNPPHYVDPLDIKPSTIPSNTFAPPMPLLPAPQGVAIPPGAVDLQKFPPPPPEPMFSFTSADMLSRRRRKSGSTNVAGGHLDLKRSASTPNVRALHAADAAAMSLAEKRRNKLGYHRVSIACSHCRRRKIRCVLAPDDPQQRCSNCIRLKKDCNFFPVDPQAPGDKRPRNPSRVGDDNMHSDSSPPMLGIVPSSDAFATCPRPYGSGSHPASFPNGLVSPMTRGGSCSHDDLSRLMIAPFDERHDYAPLPSDQAPSWHSPFADSNVVGPDHAEPTHFWPRHDSPMTPSYSPQISLPSTSMNSVSENRSSFTSFAPSRANSIWSSDVVSGPGPLPSHRSMSIAVMEDPIPSAVSYHKSPFQNASYNRRASEAVGAHHSSPLMNSDVPLATDTGNPPTKSYAATPLSSTFGSPHMQPQWTIPPTWNGGASRPEHGPGLNGDGHSSIGSATEFGTWYAEPSLAKVQEEEVAPPFGSLDSTPMVYADGQ